MSKLQTVLSISVTLLFQVICPEWNLEYFILQSSHEGLVFCLKTCTILKLKISVQRLLVLNPLRDNVTYICYMIVNCYIIMT